MADPLELVARGGADGHCWDGRIFAPPQAQVALKAGFRWSALPELVKQGPVLLFETFFEKSFGEMF